MKGEHESATDATQAETLVPQPGPGSRLAKARTAANMSVDEVASSLNLTVAMVEALERDAVDGLPAPVFVRGYIKNYARLVGLRGDELVNLYENTRAPDVPLELRPRPASESPRMRHGISPRAIVVVLLLVAAGMAAWWWAQGGRIDFGRLLGSASPEPVTLPAEVVPSRIVVAPEADPVPPSVVTPAADTPPAGTAEAGVTATTGAGLPLVGEGAPGALPAEAPVAQPAPEPPPPPAPSGHELGLTLSDDVWVEVVDSTGARLVFDMLRAGSRREVRGEGPFLVLLGKAGAVKVELDGRSVDHSSFENKGIARFVLDDQGGEIVTRNP